ncbi:MAG: NUDIX domain-containing protein [Dehalococcoidia bacterium]|nr:NUDIX domain-containing protein [Dehalococcoidia bacterium]
MAASNLRTERVTSAGGVVVRPGADGYDVLICGRSADNLWALPKGTPEPGETMERTALREVREETGVDVAVDGLIGDIRYWFSRPQEGVRFLKTVRHYLFHPIGGDTSLHDHEFDDVRWVAAQAALKMLTYQNEARILRQALELLKEREEEKAS